MRVRRPHTLRLQLPITRAICSLQSDSCSLLGEQETSSHGRPENPKWDGGAGRRMCPRFLHYQLFFPSTSILIHWQLWSTIMKSWNEVVPLIAPAQRRPASHGGDWVRIRALGLIFAACMAMLGFDALFPNVKNWHPPSWKGPVVSEKPFDWSEVCS
jgi:hypothetical protein